MDVHILDPFDILNHSPARKNLFLLVTLVETSLNAPAPPPLDIFKLSLTAYTCNAKIVLVRFCTYITLFLTVFPIHANLDPTRTSYYCLV